MALNGTTLGDLIQAAVEDVTFTRPDGTVGRIGDSITPEARALQIKIWEAVAGRIVAHIQSSGAAVMATHVHGGVTTGLGVSGLPYPSPTLEHLT